MLRTFLACLTLCMPTLCGATCGDESQAPPRSAPLVAAFPEAQAYLDTLSPEDMTALKSMHPNLQRLFLTPTIHGIYGHYTRPDRSLLVPFAGLSFNGDGAFMGDVLEWYHPSVEDVAHISSLGFKPYQLPAALRLRALISEEKAPHLARLMPDNPFDAFLPLALSAGLSPEVLAQAASLPKEVQYGFLKDYPRTQEWYLSMLGVDPWVDYALLRPWFIQQMVRNVDLVESVEALLLNGEDPRRMAVFFLATYHNGGATCRLRPHLDMADPLSPFLTFVADFMFSRKINYYFKETDLYKIMMSNTVQPLHGFFGSRHGGNIYIINGTPCEAPLPFKELMGKIGERAPEAIL